MHGEIAITRVEPCGFAELPHRLQAEKSIALDAPATFAAEQAGENVGDGIDIRGDVKSPPQQVVTGIDHHRDFFWWNDLPQAVDELGAASAAREHTNHAALSTLARPLPSAAVCSFAASKPGREAVMGKNSG